MTHTTVILAWLPRPSHWPGITEKLRQQAAAAARSHVPVRIVAAVGEDIDLGGDVSVIRCDRIAGSDWPIRSRFARYELLSRAVPGNAARIVLRMPGAADPSLPAFLRRWGRRMVTEHQGDVVAERLRRDSTVLGRLRAAAEQQALRALLHGGAGAIGVTPEIADLLRRTAPCVIPITWIGNGIDAHGQQATGCRRYAGGQLDVAVLCGNPAPWHGLDRLMAGMCSYNGPERLVVHLIGQIDTPLSVNMPSQVHTVIHGRLAGGELDRTLAQMHLGISSLALHRAGLAQACPLKSREFAARGLPFVYAYDDPDIPVELPWCLRLPGGEEAISIPQLFAFARGLPIDAPSRLRAYAIAHLDWSVKLSRLHGFATEVCA